MMGTTASGSFLLLVNRYCERKSQLEIRFYDRHKIFSCILLALAILDYLFAFYQYFYNYLIIESRSYFEMFRKYSQHNENPIVYPQHGNYIRIPHANATLSCSVDRQHDKPAFSGLKEDLSHMLKSIQNKKIIKGHYRNLSDTIQVPDENCNRVQQVTVTKGKSEEIRAMQEKILKMQEKINRIYNKIQNVGFDKYLEETIIGDFIKESENKINVVTLVIAELKEKVQNINLRLSMGTKMQCHNIKIDCQNLQKPNDKIEHFESIIEQIKKQLNHKICELNDKLKATTSNRDFEQAINPQSHFFRTNRKYSGNYISFIYEQYIRKHEKEGEKQIKQMEISNRQCINQITYYIDWQGFLLDENCHYLVNSQMKQIKLSQKELKMLRKNKILQG